jgi:hypothetical protein
MYALALCSRRARRVIIRTAISPLPSTIASKVRPSMTRACRGSSAVAVAVRGLPLRIAISPKNSPGPMTASVRSPEGNTFEMRTRPVWITNISSPAIALPEEHLSRRKAPSEARGEGF